MTATFDHWINGRSTPSDGNARLTTRIPEDGSETATIALGTAVDVYAAVQAATAATFGWRRRKPIERGRLLMNLAAAITEHVEELGRSGVRRDGQAVLAATGGDPCVGCLLRVLRRVGERSSSTVSPRRRPSPLRGGDGRGHGIGLKQ